MIGRSYNTTITNCYTAGSIKTPDNGFAGAFINSTNTEITNCYLYIKINGPSYITTTNNYNNYYYSGDINGVKTNTIYTTSGTEITNLTDDDMTNASNYADWDTEVWDFTTIPPTYKSQGKIYTTTVTGDIDVSGTPDEAFDRQLDGTIEFSNGASVDVSATDTRTQVLNKINGISGMTATVGGDGKITITADGVTNLEITSDTSNFSQIMV